MKYIMLFLTIALFSLSSGMAQIVDLNSEIKKLTNDSAKTWVYRSRGGNLGNLGKECTKGLDYTYYKQDKKVEKWECVAGVIVITKGTWDLKVQNYIDVVLTIDLDGQSPKVYLLLFYKKEGNDWMNNRIRGARWEKTNDKYYKHKDYNE